MVNVLGAWSRHLPATALLLAGSILHSPAHAAQSDPHCEDPPRPCVSVSSGQLVLFPSQSISRSLTCPASHPAAYKVNYNTDSGQVLANQELNEQQSGSSNSATNWASGASHYVTFYLECLLDESTAP